MLLNSDATGSTSSSSGKAQQAQFKVAIAVLDDLLSWRPKAKSALEIEQEEEEEAEAEAADDDEDGSKSKSNNKVLHSTDIHYIRVHISILSCTQPNQNLISLHSFIFQPDLTLSECSARSAQSGHGPPPPHLHQRC